MTWRDVYAMQWRDDLCYLVEQLHRLHRNLFHTISRDAFDRAVRALNARLPSLASHERIVEFARLVACIGDGHTVLRLTDVPHFRRYPLRLYQYRDGLFVQAITPEYAEAAGARVLAIGDTPADDAYAAMRAAISSDNEMGVKATAPALLSIPEVLHAREVIEDPEQAHYTLQLPGGRRLTTSLTPVDQLPPAMVDARDAAAAPAPLWLMRSPEHNWWTYLPDTQSMYVQYSRVRDGADERLAAFFDVVFDAVEREPVERFILDIRQNGGGNMALNQPLVHHLIRSDVVNQWGKFFAIIGRQTFSAAMNLAVDLERHTRVLFAGEPTGSRPNVYGENADIVLPHSGLHCTAAALWWQYSDPNDDRPWITPNIWAPLAAEDYATNHDPALAAILHYVMNPRHTVDYPNRLMKQLRRDDLLLPL